MTCRQFWLTGNYLSVRIENLFEIDPSNRIPNANYLAYFA